MAEYCNNSNPVKKDVNKNNSDRDSAEYQEVISNLIAPTTNKKKSEPQTEKLVINLHHTYRGKLVRMETEEEVEAKRKADAKRENRRIRFQMRKMEAEKFCDECLDFTNFRIPVYESDEDRNDRLTFETVKYYAERSKYTPSKSKTEFEKHREPSSTDDDDDEFLKEEEFDSNHNKSK